MPELCGRSGGDASFFKGLKTTYCSEFGVEIDFDCDFDCDFDEE